MLRTLNGLHIVASVGGQLLATRFNDKNYIIDRVKGRRGGREAYVVAGPFTGGQLYQGPRWNWEVPKFRIDYLVYDDKLRDVQEMSPLVEFQVPGLPRFVEGSASRNGMDTASELVARKMVPPAAVKKYMTGLEMVLADCATRTDLSDMAADVEAATIAREEARRDPLAAERLTASAAVLLQRLGRDQLTGAIVMRSAVYRGKEILERQRRSKAPRALW